MSAYVAHRSNASSDLYLCDGYNVTEAVDQDRKITGVEMEGSTVMRAARRQHCWTQECSQGQLGHTLLLPQQHRLAIYRPLLDRNNHKHL